ncbi:MAG: response regulator [Candidatus Latescibacterota bacterium]|nr:MAG: response regulator [Candidatus Latescibacterota bacterium]
MGNKLDSTSLFLSQVNQHCDVLGDLLARSTEDRIDEKLLNHCIVSTKMLASSSSLMDFGDWETALESFETLLKKYRDDELPWDERIAQITSEFIEREDELVASAGLTQPANIEDAVCAEGLQALSREVNELLEYAAVESCDPMESEGGDRSDSDSIAAQSDAPDDDEAGQAGHIEDHASATLKNMHSRPKGIQPGVCAAELRTHVDRLISKQEALGEGAVELSKSELESLRQDLCLVDFYASSMEMMLRDSKQGGKSEIKTTLAPIGFAIRDFASALCDGTDRHITVELTGENHSLDLRLLKPIRQILNCLLEDIVLRCVEPKLEITIAVTDENGALRWNLSDNGDNFLNDSRLDPDECLAFYPGLRQVRKILYKFRSLLWVEPDENGATRFAFTTPLTLDTDQFKVWRDDESNVAVLPNQLGSVIDAGSVEIGVDSRGEYLTIDGRRVPLLRLGQIYSGAPTEGDRIAVVGFLEKRIAFYVEGDERLETGTWHRDAVSAWRGMQEGVVEIGGETIPLVDANSLLKRYLTIVDVPSGGGASGGIGDDDAEGGITNTRRAAVASPDEPGLPGVEETDVLVVEQSESLRSAIAAILASQKIRSKLVESLDSALEFLSRGRAALIVSDFRVPSMAAKALAEKLEREGQDTPVLVTTSHSRDSAEVLVKSLGIAGYISKPLLPDQLLSQVSTFLGSPRTPASRT